MLRALLFIVVIAICVGANASNKKMGQKMMDPQEQHDYGCRESDLRDAKEDKDGWKQYLAECAPRPLEIRRFWQTVNEYRERCAASQQVRKQANKHGGPKDSDVNYGVAVLKCDRAEHLLRDRYLTLYELERQEVFARGKAVMVDVVKLSCPRRAGQANLRRAFARCYVHQGFQEMDGYYAWVDSLPKAVHKQLQLYEYSLEKRGLLVP